MNARSAVWILVAAGLLDAVPAEARQAVDAPRPIPMGESLWTEELTWMDVRDRLAEGFTTILVGTGGVEQNGPYLATGKHNYVLETVLPYIAREIGGTLIAPVVAFVPEGNIEPTPSGHMAYPGTISVSQATFEALLGDIARSYAAHGFRDIVFIGDSGGNQNGMANVAAALNQRWSAEGSPARVHHLPEYYDEDRWSYDFLKSRGITQIDSISGRRVDERTDRRNGMHTDVYYEAQTAVQDPALIRAGQREALGMLNLHGVDLTPVSRTVELGRSLAEYRAGITARAFRASMGRLRGQPR
jgi:creatinine amidohydrolase/Fe(II)-dependent formamide hydrolase-like protein